MRVVHALDELSAGPHPDLLIAVHAIKSRWAIEWARGVARRPRSGVLFAGTDIYAEDGQAREWSAEAVQALEIVDRFVALQPLVLEALPAPLRARTQVIWQSARPVQREGSATGSTKFLVLGHLRSIKDPFLAARAVHHLPAESPVEVLHAGALLEPELAEELEKHRRSDRPWSWLGELSRSQAREQLARCRGLIVSSLAEGGANVISEAIVAGVPVIASRVAGNVGMLGEDYPGYFEVGDASGLAGTLQRVIEDRGFEAELLARIRALAPRHQPERECEAWREWLQALA